VFGDLGISKWALVSPRVAVVHPKDGLVRHRSRDIFFGGWPDRYAVPFDMVIHPYSGTGDVLGFEHVATDGAVGSSASGPVSRVGRGSGNVLWEL
jgi:hypothetical protein